jgi:23S rRNA (guanosine2251-2'-O)-methyltransferase
VRTLYGVNPVRELLRAGGEGLSELWLVEGGTRGRAFQELDRLARSAGAKVRTAPRQKLERLAGTANHQGVVAVVGDYRYREVEDLLAAAAQKGEPPLLVLLDGVEDPHNLGAIVRSAHALGAHGVVIPRDRAVGVTPAAAKASAGAVEHCPVARVTNLSQAILGLKDSGVWSVATAADAGRSLEELDLTGAIALVVGGEGEGIRPLVRRSCDLEARVPMAGEVGSLNASAAAAIALYEAVRQRRARTGRQGGPEGAKPKANEPLDKGPGVV